MIDDPPPPSTDPMTVAARRPTRPRWRLRLLIALGVVSFGLYVFVRLDRSAAECLGPVGEGLHDLFNQVPGKATPLTAISRRLVEDVEALGGLASIHVTKPGVFGTIGQVEWTNVTFRTPDFDDAAFARLAEAHGDRIGELSLENTGVTDSGLKNLARFTMLRHLSIRNLPPPRRPEMPRPSPQLTDAGMVHLKRLDHLWSLNLDNLPITDAGLGAIDDLPELLSLYLSGTKVQGLGLSKLKSLPRLAILYLDGGAMTEDGLKALSAATSLQCLSLKRVPLTPGALALLKAISRVDRLELTGCGFLDEEVADLIKSRPGLRVIRD